MAALLPGSNRQTAPVHLEGVVPTDVQISTAGYQQWDRRAQPALHDRSKG
jgi:hypothetical protein